MLATVQEEQSLGHLQELTSPVLGKLKEALIFTRLANSQRRAFGSRTVVLEGQLGARCCDLFVVVSCLFHRDDFVFAGFLGSELHLGWFEEARLLVMAYKVHGSENSECTACNATPPLLFTQPSVDKWRNESSVLGQNFAVSTREQATLHCDRSPCTSCRISTATTSKKMTELPRATS